MKKAKALLSGMVPVALMLFVQVMAAIISTLLIMFAAWILSFFHINGEGFLQYLIAENVFIVSILSYGFFFLVGLAWYKKLRLFPVCTEEGEKAVLDKKAILRIGVAAVFFQCAITALLYILQMMAPELMVEYMEVMEELGINKPSLLSVIYVVLLAPLAEEVLFRGLCLRILWKEFSFPVANVIQAVFFGLYHMNLIQGIYAFLLGLLLGTLMKKYGTLKASWTCHFVINFTGQALTMWGVGPMGVFVGAFLFGMVFLFLYMKQR